MNKNKLIGTGALIAAVGLLLLAGVFPALAQGTNQPCPYFQNNGSGQGMMGGGSGKGMMGGSNAQDCGQFGFGGMMGGMMDHMMQGMMGDSNMMGSTGFGPGAGMMGTWSPPKELAPATETLLTLDEAVKVAEAYVAAWDAETPLKLGEVMQFDSNFYGIAVEEETGRSAFEFLIDPATGTVIGEYGPNMMWNLRYGHMNGGGMMGLWRLPSVEEAMTITVEQAVVYAQEYLNEFQPDFTADTEADTFYGYYTLHTLKDGEITGMLSVNGYTGEVWFHTWHGDFIDMVGHGE